MFFHVVAAFCSVSCSYLLNCVLVILWDMYGIGMSAVYCIGMSARSSDFHDAKAEDSLGLYVLVCPVATSLVSSMLISLQNLRETLANVSL